MTNDSRTISHPLQKLLCVVNGKKGASRGRWEGATSLPVVHYALTKTQAESLRRRECNRLVFRVFEFPRLLPIMIKEETGTATPLKTIFNVVHEMKVIK